jgi:ABC-type sugar transport system substrate-binding protein
MRKKGGKTMRRVIFNRAVVITLASIVAVFMVAGVGFGEAKLGEGLTFTYVTGGDPANPFQATTVRGWKEAAAALKVNENVNFGYGDLSKVIDYVNSAVATGVDGIFIFSLDPEGLHPSIVKAREAGIEVVTMSSRDTEYDGDEVPFVGFSLDDQGYTLGKYIAKQLKSPAHVAFFAEFVAPYSDMRKKGFLKALDDAGISYTASDTYECGEELARAIDTIKTYLLAHPETSAVIGLGSVTTPSGAVAMQDLGYEPGKVKWGGFDLLPETVEGIKAGYGGSNVDEVFNYGFWGCMALYLRAKYDFVVGDLPVATSMVDQSNIKGFEAWVEKGIK